MNVRTASGSLFLSALCGIILTCANGALADTAQYTVTDLGTLPGTVGSYACGINAGGQVVGYSMNSSGVSYAFIYSGTAMTNLGITSASSINDNGLVVGSSGLPKRAFLCNGDLKTNLGTFPGAGGIHDPFPISYATGINASGQIIGVSETASCYDHAFLYSSGYMKDLGTLSGGVGSDASGINASGQVVGGSYPDFDGIKYKHAFLYSNNVMQDLGTLSGKISSDASAINDNGQIVGCSYTNSPSDGHAFLYSGGIMQDLGALPSGTVSEAFGINAGGQVVGTASTTGGWHAFLYSGGTMQDLNNLVAPSSGWTLTQAIGINNNGQIIADGTNSLGQRGAFLLTPVPEPATMSLLGIGLLGLLRRRQS